MRRELGPIIHTSTLRMAGMSILSMTEASRPFVTNFCRSKLRLKSTRVINRFSA
jgi:hypothetical protein